jgi:hypothetical protein
VQAKYCCNPVLPILIIVSLTWCTVFFPLGPLCARVGPRRKQGRGNTGNTLRLLTSSLCDVVICGTRQVPLNHIPAVVRGDLAVFPFFYVTYDRCYCALFSHIPAVVRGSLAVYHVVCDIRQVLLHEFEVPHEAFTPEVMACLPPAGKQQLPTCLVLNVLCAQRWLFWIT